jgi:hypothetical protein
MNTKKTVSKAFYHRKKCGEKEEKKYEEKHSSGPHHSEHDTESKKYHS